MPDAYEGVTAADSGKNLTSLPRGSYVVSKEVTAFLSYDDSGVVLLFSTNQGESWQRSVLGEGFPSRSFVSVAGGKILVGYAVDRAAGSDYFALKQAEISRLDSSWNDVEVEPLWESGLTMVALLPDGSILLGRTNALLYLRTDGASVNVEIPASAPSTSLGYEPFTTPIVAKEVQALRDSPRQYCTDAKSASGECESRVEVILSQGSDGDYTENGTLAEGVYAFDPVRNTLSYLWSRAVPALHVVG